MTQMRHLDDLKRGYPTTVGALAKLINRHKVGAYLSMTREERATMRETMLDSAARAWSDGIGERVSVLNALDELTPGQVALLRWKVRP